MKKLLSSLHLSSLHLSSLHLSSLHLSSLQMVPWIAGALLAASCARDPTPPPNPGPSPRPSSQPSPEPATFDAVGTPILVDSTGAKINGTSGVPQNSSIRVTFNENLDPASVLVNLTSMSTVLLTYVDSTGQTIDMPNVSASVSGQTLTISAANGFYGGSSFTLLLYTGLYSTIKQGLQTPVQFGFTTAGHPPGSEVQLGITYDFGAQGSTGVDHFTLSYGTQSRVYTQQNLPLTIDQMQSTWSGSLALSSTYRATFLSGVTYYFAVQACTASGSCSGYSPEATGGMP